MTIGDSIKNTISDFIYSVTIFRAQNFHLSFMK